MDKNNLLTKLTPKKKKTNVMVEPLIWEKFKRFARLKDKDTSEYMMELVTSELKNKEDEFNELDKKNRIRLDQATKKVWDEEDKNSKKNKQR